MADDRVTKAGIVYSTGSKMIRRIIYPDDDSDLERFSWVGAGESLLIVDKLDGVTPERARQEVEAATGAKVPDHVSAVVDPKTETVTDLICADPELDSVEGGELIHCYSKEIVPGCKYDSVKREFYVPEKVVVIDGQDVVVEAKPIPKEPVVVIDEPVLPVDAG